MPDQAALLGAIRAQFPLIFGDKEMVPASQFYEAYNAVAEHSIRSSEPALKSETHKHQWTLAATSIGLIALILFKVGDIKIGNTTVTVNRNVLIWYGVFLLAMLLSFLLRAMLDLRRAALARNKDSEKLSVLTDLVQMAWARRNIQQYFWMELFYQIGLRYAAYYKARSNTDDEPSLGQIDMRVKLDIESLRKLEDFREEICAHEEFVNKLVANLDSDLQRFEDKVLEHDHPIISPQSRGHKDWERFSAVTALYDRHLKAWFEARNSLSSATLDAATDKRAMLETKMLDAQLALLQQARTIRRLYAFSEIAVPTILAVGALTYAWTAVGGA